VESHEAAAVLQSAHMLNPSAVRSIFSVLGATALPRTPQPEMMGSIKILETFGPDAFPSEWPYTSEDMRRLDESADIYFYGEPRFVTHIDDGAIAALTSYYREALSPGDDVLDICSSWISHLPKELELGRVVGVGMNARELEANERLTEFVQLDLNVAPTLPFDDASFDAILNVVSVDYLSKPKEVFAEMHRVLRPGGSAIMSFSNRCFPSKAVEVWLSQGDTGRRKIVASYFGCSPPGGWKEITALDIRAGGPGDVLSDPLSWLKTAVGDPMFVVRATRA
jgi:SAM-dependent methyltransferase